MIDKNDKGYLVLDRVWKNDDVIEIIFHMGITKSTIPGNDKMAAFHYGPLTLVGLCKKPVTFDLPENLDDFLIHDNEREWGSWKSTFRTTGQQKNIRFVPIHEVGYEYYTLYFDIK